VTSDCHTLLEGDPRLPRGTPALPRSRGRASISARSKETSPVKEVFLDLAYCKPWPYKFLLFEPSLYFEVYYLYLGTLCQHLSSSVSITPVNPELGVW
jgi:hypothetical protein